VRRFRDRGEATDLMLNHDVESFKIHRIVICPWSQIFYRACTGGFEVVAPHNIHSLLILRPRESHWCHLNRTCILHIVKENVPFLLQHGL
jgi:hypothetical protein